MKKSSGPKWKMRRSKYLVTLEAREAYYLDWKPRRIITIDLRAIPINEGESRMWFMGLVGRIWWDVTDTESASVTNRAVDQLVSLAAKARDEWEAEDAADAIGEAS